MVGGIYVNSGDVVFVVVFDVIGMNSFFVDVYSCVCNIKRYRKLVNYLVVEIFGFFFGVFMSFFEVSVGNLMKGEFYFGWVDVILVCIEIVILDCGSFVGSFVEGDFGDDVVFVED